VANRGIKHKKYFQANQYKINGFLSSYIFQALLGSSNFSFDRQ